MHESAEKFDPRTEQAFKVLQVISACAMSFAHGANDVANSIGSFCAAFYVYQNQAVPGSSAEVRGWRASVCVAAERAWRAPDRQAGEGWWCPACCACCVLTRALPHHHPRPRAPQQVYPWILALGATGIVIGLATYGACGRGVAEAAALRVSALRVLRKY